MHPIEKLISESDRKEKTLLGKVWLYLFFVIVAYVATLYLFLSNVLSTIPLLLAGAICAVNIALTIKLIITMADVISEAKYQNELAAKIPPAIPQE